MGDSIWQLEIDDTSPTISYSPFPDTFSLPNLAAGWNPYYDQSGFAPAQGAIGNGSSSHITSMNSASFSIRWKGTGIQIFGNTTQASLLVTIDSALLQNESTSVKPITATGNGLLLNKTDLPDGLHTLTFTALIASANPVNSSMVVFDKVVLLTSVPPPSTILYQRETINIEDINFNGSWQSDNSLTGGYRISQAAGDSATTTFNGTSFTLLGSTSPDGANFSVVIDGVNATMSARSSFRVDNTTLFFVSSLNASIEHTVEISNDSGGELSLLSDGFLAVTPSASSQPSPAGATSSNSSFSKGAIAALSLAGILAFLLLSAVILYFCVYRRKGRKHSFYTFSRPDSGYKASRGQQWLQDIVNRSPKQQEAGVTGYGDVVEIRPGLNDSKYDLADIDEVTRESTVIHEKLDSSNTGGNNAFTQWRREAVQGSMRGIGLPILFKRTGSEAEVQLDEHPRSPTQGSTTRYSHVRDDSEGSTDSSSERRYIAMANLRNKGKARQLTGTGSSPRIPSRSVSTRRSWTSSFRLALPIHSPSKPSGSKFGWNFPGTSRQNKQDPSTTSQQSKSLPSSPGGHQTHLSTGSGQDQVSSFIAASDPSPVTTRKRITDALPLPLPREPQRDSNLSSNALSIPRSVSHSGSNSPVEPTFPRSPLHQYEKPITLSPGVASEAGQFLNLGSPQSSETSYPVQNVQRLEELNPPQTQSFAIDMPIDSRRGRESVTSEDPSTLAHHSVGQAIRGLSPRTTERGAGSSSGTSLGLGLLYPSARQSIHTQVSGLSSEDSGSPVEFARNISPSGIPLALQSTTSLGTTTLEDPQWQQIDSLPDEPMQLDLRAVSPFNVDFDWRSVRTRTNISHSSADDTPGFSQSALSRQSTKASTKASHPSPSALPPPPPSSFPAFVAGSSRAPFRLTMATIAPPPAEPSVMSGDMDASFLDFTSSREGSVRTKSLRTVASHEKIFGDAAADAPPLPSMPTQEPRSRWSNTTVPSFNTRRFTGVTKESSLDSDSNPVSDGERSSMMSNTFPIHVNMTVPPSPHHIMDLQEEQTRQHAPHQTSSTGRPTDLRVHPVLDLASPTDSVPQTVSDVHFRENDEAFLSRRTTASSADPETYWIPMGVPRIPGPIPEEPPARRPLPQINMVPASPQNSNLSPSTGRPRPLPVPPGTRSNTLDTSPE